MDASQQQPILIVEDSPEIARYLAAQLSHFNYRAHVIPSAVNLLPALEQIGPVALIVDITLPEGDIAGPLEIMALRESGANLPPVVFVSGRDDIAARLAVVRAGSDAYFIKPVDIAKLVDRLDHLVRGIQPDPYHVLVVDDSPSLVIFYASILEDAGMVVRTETDPLKVLDALRDFPAELILMDVYMPGCSGIELAAVLRQKAEFVSIPIVFLSSETDLAKQHAAFRVGGDDFLVKPIQPEYLVSSVKTRADRYRVLRTYMVRDSLTGLLNHTAVTQHLEIDASRCRRQKSPLAVAMLDIDHFKKVNDSYGHPVGDKVIISLSRLLQQRLRKSDVVGRYGGEEFVVILPDATADAAVGIMDEIRAAFGQIIQHGGAQAFSATFSCGVAGLDAGRPGNLIEAADMALYEAKRRGRDRICRA